MKINFYNPYDNSGFNNCFVSKYIPNIEKDKKNGDVIVEYIHKGFSENFFNSPKKLLLSGENLYYKLNLFKLIEYISKKIKVDLKFLNKILPKKLLDLKLGYMRPKYLNYIKKISKNDNKKDYAIICNDIKGKNILNLPYFFHVNYIMNKIFQNKKKIKIPKKFCCILISNESAFDRINFVKKLSRYKKVDIYGKTSLTNSDNSKLPDGFHNNSTFYSQYKFVICFENSFSNEYITEKLPNVMIGKSIPIYRGAPNVGEYFNTKSFINYDDYGSYEKMIEKIIELDKDNDKYLEFANIPFLTKKNKNKIRDKESELKRFLKKIFN